MANIGGTASGIPLTNVLTTDRVFSIDALRGITILTMIFVNELAGVDGLPSWMKHAAADADTMTFVDLVFPAFLFIVGMSIPFAIVNRMQKGDSIVKVLGHICFRTLGLLILGVFMVNAESGYNEEAMMISIPLWSFLFYACVILIWNVYTFEQKQIGFAFRFVGAIGLVILAFVYKGGENGTSGLTPQWWGILGLIGWAYFIACIVYLLTRGHLTFILLFIMVGIGFFIIGKLPWAEEHSILTWMNAQKGHAIHAAIVLSGTLVSLMIFDRKNENPLLKRISLVGMFSVFCFISGSLLRPHYHISKIFATPTWALYCVGICTLVFLFLYWLIDIRGVRGWTNFIRPAATNPLLAYILPSIIFAILRILDLHWPEFLAAGLPGIFWSAFFALSVMWMVTVLNKWKIKLQL